MSVEDTESTGEGQPAGTLAEELSRAFDEVSAREVETGDEGGKPARARDASGRFAKEGGDAADDTTAGEAGDAAGKGAQEGDGTLSAEGKAEAQGAGEGEVKEGAEKAGEQPQPQGLEPPANWSPADKQRLKDLEAKSPEHAKWLLDRHKAMEADYTKKTTALADFRKEYEPVDRLFAPWRERMTAAGYRPSTLIQAWASVEQDLISGDPKRQLGVVERMIRQYRIDPKQVASALGLAAAGHTGEAKSEAGASAQPPEIPAALAPWVQELASLRDWKTQQEQRQQAEARRLQDEQQQRQQEAMQRINTEIEQFKSAVDKDGKSLLHPHFDEVEQDMSLLAQAARARGEKLSLAELYDRAVYANPTVRAKHLAAQEAAQQAKRETEARAKAAAARKAGASVTGAPSAGQTPKETAKGDSLRAQLEAAYDEHAE